MYLVEWVVELSITLRGQERDEAALGQNEVVSCLLASSCCENQSIFLTVGKSVQYWTPARTPAPYC